MALGDYVKRTWDEFTDILAVYLQNIEDKVKELDTKSTLVNLIYPVGSVYISVNSTSPATLFGGTWSAFAAGRTLVGIDAGQTEFDTVEETGGAKTHTLTTAQMPSHTHTLTGDAHAPTGESGSFSHVNGSGSHFFSYNSKLMTSVGGGEAHNNLQPYIVTYMWKRTA